MTTVNKDGIGPIVESDYVKLMENSGFKVAGSKSLALNYVFQGWKLMSCSHCQELGQQASWLLIGYTRGNIQPEARSATRLLTMTTTHKISASEGLYPELFQVENPHRVPPTAGRGTKSVFGRVFASTENQL